MSIQLESKKFVPGMILYTAWGYEQTNIDFYQVIAVKNGFATIQKMESISQSINNFQNMTTSEMPGLLIESAPKLRRKIKNYGYDYCKVESFSTACIWDGKPKNASHYA